MAVINSRHHHSPEPRATHKKPLRTAWENSIQSKLAVFHRVSFFQLMPLGLGWKLPSILGCRGYNYFNTKIPIFRWSFVRSNEKKMFLPFPLSLKMEIHFPDNKMQSLRLFSISFRIYYCIPSLISITFFAPKSFQRHFSICENLRWVTDPLHTSSFIISGFACINQSEISSGTRAVIITFNWKLNKTNKKLCIPNYNLYYFI